MSGILMRNKKRTVAKRRGDTLCLVPRKLRVSGGDIPSHTAAPVVTRVIRYIATLTSVTPTVTISYANLAYQDGQDYLSSSVARYVNMRVESLRAYAESPNSLSVSQQPYGLIVTESATGYVVKDRAITGARVSAVGLEFGLTVRSSIVSAASATAVCVLACDQTIAASTDFVVVLDVTVQFLS
jgi:hypothetical protein